MEVVETDHKLGKGNLSCCHSSGIWQVWSPLFFSPGNYPDLATQEKMEVLWPISSHISNPLMALSFKSYPWATAQVQRGQGWRVKHRGITSVSPQYVWANIPWDLGTTPKEVAESELWAVSAWGPTYSFSQQGGSVLHQQWPTRLMSPRETPTKSLLLRAFCCRSVPS